MVNPEQSKRGTSCGKCGQRPFMLIRVQDGDRTYCVKCFRELYTWHYGQLYEWVVANPPAPARGG